VEAPVIVVNSAVISAQAGRTSIPAILLGTAIEHGWLRVVRAPSPQFPAIGRQFEEEPGRFAIEGEVQQHRGGIIRIASDS
jgi:hypothetical protein